jgi:hypothetical protein
LEPSLAEDLTRAAKAQQLSKAAFTRAAIIHVIRTLDGPAPAIAAPAIWDQAFWDETGAAQ